MYQIPVVDSFMTRPVITVRSDMVIYDAIRVLLDHRISGAPVVDNDDQHLVGILSEKDCLSILINGVFHGLTSDRVQDYMTTSVVTINKEMEIFEVADIFLHKHYRRLPVVDQDGNVIGIVSRRDILTASRAMWDEKIIPPDPGYLSDEVKARLGEDGMARLYKRQHF